MFFQTTRLKSAAATGVQSMLCGLEVLGSIPESVWTDPYALGWISGFAVGKAAEYGSRNHLSVDAVARSMRSGEILAFALERIAPKAHAMEVIRRVAHLSKTNNPEFKRGSDAAMKTVAFGNGGTVDLDDPDILAATQTAKMLAEGGVFTEANRRSAITGALINQLFYDRVFYP